MSTQAINLLRRLHATSPVTLHKWDAQTGKTWAEQIDELLQKHDAEAARKTRPQTYLTWRHKEYLRQALHNEVPNAFLSPTNQIMRGMERRGYFYWNVITGSWKLTDMGRRLAVKEAT